MSTVLRRTERRRRKHGSDIIEDTPDIIEVARQTPYPLDAFLFLQRGLEFTVTRLHGESDQEADPPVSRHVTGRELCFGLRDFAMQQYGLLARTVLHRWQINASEDFGRIIFAMVEAKLLAKTDDDSIEDFRDVYDFDEGFSETLSLSENT